MHKILLVDDDENILHAYKRNLRTKFNVHTTNNPVEGLELVKSNNYSVVMSDYNMPEIKGIEFLSKVKDLKPDTVRIMLTGYADVNTAINAVNEGNIFRFLTKPCQTDDLLKTLYNAVHQYNLVVAERELLEKTLKGCMKILVDILSVTNPLAFNLGARFRAMSRKISIRLKINEIWEVEMACLLSQIGCVGVPQNVLEKKSHGEDISISELELYSSHPQIGKSLLQNIPRFENIANAIGYQFHSYNGNDLTDDFVVGDNIPFIGRLLRLLNDYFVMSNLGLDNEIILSKLYKQKEEYDPEIFGALEAELRGAKEGLTLHTINSEELKSGMVLVDGIFDSKDHLLLPKGTELSDVSIIKLSNYAKMGGIKEPIKVYTSNLD